VDYINLNGLAYFLSKLKSLFATNEKVSNHIDNMSNPHCVTLSHLGINTTAAKLNDLTDLVGDIAVSEQINTAIENAEMLTIDITDTIEGVANGINAETFGGLLPSDYVDQIKFNNNIDIINTSIQSFKTDVANNYLLKNEANNYLPKNGTSVNSEKLNNYDISEIMLMLYPVGSIYISTVSTNPSTLFGGTWEQLKERFLLGAGDSYMVNDTGGEATHKLTEEELPYHKHQLLGYAFSWGDGAGNINIANAVAQAGASSGNRLYTNQGQWNSTGYVGSNVEHNNMPPYLVVYMWKRVA